MPTDHTDQIKHELSEVVQDQEKIREMVLSGLRSQISSALRSPEVIRLIQDTLLERVPECAKTFEFSKGHIEQFKYSYQQEVRRLANDYAKELAQQDFQKYLDSQK